MNVLCIVSAMGSHSFKQLTSYLVLLCVLFVNHASESLVRADIQKNSQNQEDFVDGVNSEEDLDMEDQGQLQKNIIEGLGLRRIPDVTKINVSQEEYTRMYDVYLRRTEEKQTGYSTESKAIPKLYTFLQKEKSSSSMKKRRRGVTQLFFDVASLNGRAAVEHATLRFLAPGVQPEFADSAVKYQLFQITPSDKNTKTRNLVKEADIYLAATDSKWCDIDITLAVQRWLTQENMLDEATELQLELQCSECMQKGISFAPISDAVVNVLVRVESDRNKRSAEDILYYKKDRRTDCHKNNKRCCRQEMNFELEQLGFHFIIQPKIFDGGICKGRCPPYYNAAHNHALIQSIMWKKNKTLTPRVCCAPSKLTHLEVLTVDEEDPTKLTVKDLPDMIVQECACS